ncbi:MAG: hypothetical protein M3Q39_03875 [Actinomycetota bacterium]|nr:hypothetical protein [Actinomycetota bacterium]
MTDTHLPLCSATSGVETSAPAAGVGKSSGGRSRKIPAATTSPAATASDVQIYVEGSGTHVDYITFIEAWNGNYAGSKYGHTSLFNTETGHISKVADHGVSSTMPSRQYKYDSRAPSCSGYDGLGRFG